MDPRLVVRGIVIGLAVAAPVGPVSLFVIRRTLAAGARAGLASGLGAAVADAVFALAGALGIAGAAAGLGAPAAWLRAAGGVFLCTLGARALLRRRRAAAPERERERDARGHARAFFGTLLFTLASPMSILSFAAVAASLGVRAGATRDAVALVCGVFSGSALWWLALAGGVGALRRRVPAAAFLWLDRASALALLAFGVAALSGV
jgi:threonine/homoserine/homoserine lactone efflux protein